MLIALGLDESQGVIAKIQLQRIADIASMAGGLRGASTATGVPSLCASVSHALYCADTSAAADSAEVNGVQGATTRSWNDATFTLTDNMVTAAIISGVKTASDPAIKVTVSRSLPSIFAYPVDGQANYIVSATAASEIFTSPSTATTGTQPCMTSLTGNVTFSSGVLDLNGGCSLRSNAAVTLNGTINALSIYAATTISGYANNVPEHPNAGQIPDPYATNTAIQTAFSDLTTQPTKTYIGANTISPGTYPSIAITCSNCNTTMSPGLYVVEGNFSITGANSNVSGSGVTIVVGGTVNIAGTQGSNLNVSAPGTSATNGAIPGVLLAGNGTSGVTIGGSNAFTYSGVLYFPNSNMTFTGTTNASNSCLEVLAGSITVNGNENFVSSNCSNLGATSFGSVPVPGASTASLVE